MSYLVCGQINLHRSDICGGDFVRYLHDIPQSYRLSKHGDISSKMDHYRMISKPIRNKQLERLRKAKADRSPKGKRDKRGINAHTVVNSAEVIESAREFIPENLESMDSISSLWNKDLHEGLMPFPQSDVPNEFLPDAEDVIIIDDKQINLSKLNENDRKEAIHKWQTNVHLEDVDQKGPSGFIFGLQEIYYKNGRAGAVDKTGHTLLFDKSADRPRAAILASKNLSIFMDTDLSGPDLCIAKYLTGNEEMPEVYIASVYCDIEEKDEIVPKNLKRCIKRCIDNNLGFILYGDLNSHSRQWHCPDDNARGLIMESDLIAKYSLNVLNNCDTPSYYGCNTTGTIPDVTMCTSNTTKFIKNWLNRDAVPSSDHASYEHTLFLGQPLVEAPRFKFKEAKPSDWYGFKSNLEQELKKLEFPDKGNYETFNSNTNLFYEKIYEALEATISKTKPKPLSINKTARGDHWHDEKCKRLEKRIKTIRNYIRKNLKNPSPVPRFTKADETEAKNEYWAEVKKSKDKAYRKHIESREGSSQMGSFNKKFLKKATANAAIPLFHKAEGTQMTPDETIEELMKEHFPDCRDEVEQAPFISARLAKEIAATYDLDDKEGEFLTLEKVMDTMNSFEKLKSVGSDDLPPLVYQWFGPVAWSWLHKIYKATYLLKLLPRKWLDVKVLFIPKHGKKTLCEPRSWRPISLMQYQMKGKEKLLIKDNEIGKKPIHNNQHGFRKARSCMSSLSSKVGRIEKALVDHGFALAVYLDIKGAFDHCRNHCITRACQLRGCKTHFVEWFADFFNNRRIIIDFKGKQYTKYCAMGTPQGSTASPYFWNLIADELHEAIDNIEGVASEGFADDTCFVAIGEKTQKLQEVMQQALKAAEKWAEDHQLEFSASKTVVMLYTNRRKFEMPEKLILLGETLEYKNQVKHLGLHITNKLNWLPHLKEKIKEGKGIIVRLKSSMGKLWGLKPKMAMWVYRMVVRPVVTYASAIWSKIVHKKHVKELLTQFQSFALHQMGYFREKTAQNALEVITNTMPLDLHILFDAQLSYIRTKGHEKYEADKMHTDQPELRGHRQVICDFSKTIDTTHLLEENLDDIAAMSNFDKKFTVDTYSYDPRNPDKGIPQLETDCNLYTDGSRFGPYRCGAGLSVWKIHNDNGKKTERTIVGQDKISYYLEDASIFQCETFGVQQSANWLIYNHKEHNIHSATINVDSQACIKALKANKIKLHSVFTAVQALNQAARALPGGLKIRWVKAHVDHSDNHRGNVAADVAARAGAEGEGILYEHDLPRRTFATVKHEIFKKMQSQWNLRWKNNTLAQAPAIASKLWFPEINPKKSYEIAHNRSRYDYSVFVHCITGSNHLAYFEKKLKTTDSAMCTYCSDPNMVETAKHLFTECEALAQQRLQIFGHHDLSDKLHELPINQVARFLTYITWMPGDDEINDTGRTRPPPTGGNTSGT